MMMQVKESVLLFPDCGMGSVDKDERCKKDGADGRPASGPILPPASCGTR